MNQKMRVKNPDFAFIEAEVLTIGIQRTLGTRGNFGLVSRYQRAVVVSAWLLPVKGVPKDR
ncbi:MAG: hypothetical protein GY801_16175 [bacterium]|nr:hypothetical protein [bacterium]